MLEDNQIIIPVKTFGKMLETITRNAVISEKNTELLMQILEHIKDVITEIKNGLRND